MLIRSPATSLKPPNPFILKQGTVIERLHNRKYLGNLFNPGLGSPTRFTPIDDARGMSVPTLYAADTLEAAIYETIFHDIPENINEKRVPKRLVTARAHSKLEVTRNLKLASLREADLRKWQITRNDLITTSPKFYISTVKWAEAIHHQFADIEGLIWTSYQCDPDSAYFFFGDRVLPGDLKIIAIRDGLIDPTFLSDVRRAGMRSGIKITL